MKPKYVCHSSYHTFLRNDSKMLIIVMMISMYSFTRTSLDMFLLLIHNYFVAAKIIFLHLFVILFTGGHV